DFVFEHGCRDVVKESSKPRANAAFVVLCRNSELEGVITSMRSLERHFNQWFNYPWIFLNNEKFTKEFKTKVAQLASGQVKFGFIPQSKWDFPDETNENITYFNEGIEAQGDRGILYGSMPSYHKMCRFYSGYFFKHPMVRKLDYYWRVEPDVQFFCDLTYDPFIEMEMNNKTYGFNVAIKELINTVPNLFRYTKAFIKDQNIQLGDSFEFFANDLLFYKGDNSIHYKSIKNKDQFYNKLQERIPMMNALNLSKSKKSKKSLLKKLDQHSVNKLIDHSNKRGLPLANKEQFDNNEFTMCHFWSNFEIARTDLFTSLPYQQYFEFLESSKGFYTERWGDAPIHSLAAGMFLNYSNIHYFRDIGYEHSTLTHCPYNAPLQKQKPYEKSKKYKNLYVEHDENYWLNYDKSITSNGIGVGCRCRCPDNFKEVEISSGSCMPLWASLVDDGKPAKKYLDLN
ncbi:glycosyltransferase family 15 protein, partial [[Candida] arabinofermentans NRRL YB-2248]